MNTLRIEFHEGRRTFAPHEAVTGTVVWQVDKQPQSAELRLIWFTRGKGTEDSSVVETVGFHRPQASESQSFSLRLPQAPYSFSGKLISLVWALELVVSPGKNVCREEITMAPGGAEIMLHELPGGDKPVLGRFFKAS